MKKITKSNSSKFVKLLDAELKKLTDNIKTIYCFTEYVLNTKYGELKITLRDDNTYSYTVFTCFSDVEKIKVSNLAANMHSGKWNHHIDSYNSPSEAVDIFISELNQIL